MQFRVIVVTNIHTQTGPITIHCATAVVCLCSVTYKFYPTDALNEAVSAVLEQAIC